MQSCCNVFNLAGQRGWRRAAAFASHSTAIALLFAAGGMDGASCNPDPPPPPTCDPLSLFATDHVLGDGNAPVTVVEYGDFQCPFCGRFGRETFPVLKQNYVDTGRVRWVFRHFPLSSQCNPEVTTDLHPNACGAARASECAHDQGQFYAYHDELYEHQDDGLELDKLKEYAVNVGLNSATFDPCAEGDSKASRVRADIDSGIALGLTSTPTFWVNCEKVVGFKTAQEFSQIIDRHLP